MSDLIENIPECVVNGASLLSAEYANKLIRTVNALKNMIINPTINVAVVTHTKSQFILDLSQADSRLSALENTVTGGPSSGSSNANTSISGRITTLETRANHITITANGTCNAGVITINISATM